MAQERTRSGCLHVPLANWRGSNFLILDVSVEGHQESNLKPQSEDRSSPMPPNRVLFTQLLKSSRFRFLLQKFPNYA
jgi:hypothetical protein